MLPKDKQLSPQPLFGYRLATGFTIVELIVVILIVSVIMIVVGRVFSDMFRIRDTVEAKAVIEVGAIAATEWLRRDIAGSDSFQKWKDDLYSDTVSIYDLPALDDSGATSELARSLEFSALTAVEVFGSADGFEGTDDTGVVIPVANVLTMRVTSDDYDAGPASSVYVRYYIYDKGYQTGNAFCGNLYREVVRKKPDIESEQLVVDGERARFWDPKKDTIDGTSDPDYTLIDRFIVARNIMNFSLTTMMIDVSDPQARVLRTAYKNNPASGAPDYGAGDHRYLLMRDLFETNRAMVQALKISFKIDTNGGDGQQRVRDYEIMTALPRALLSAMDEDTQ